MQGRPLEILLVDDNPADVQLTRHAFRKNGGGSFHVVSDGADALAYLRQQSPYQHAARPDLVLLDLNLPKIDGRQVLAVLKADPLLASIPVIILTTSDSDEDISRSYGLHCNCYLTKPHDLHDFQNLVRGVEAFWFTLAKLPPRQS